MVSYGVMPYEENAEINEPDFLIGFFTDFFYR